MGTAGTQAAGLWQFLVDATHSKQVHTGKACFDGIFAAYSARDGLLGPHEILEGPRAMGVALGQDGKVNPSAIDRDLGKENSYVVLGSSFKWHASCRHTHPSVDALLHLMRNHTLTFSDIDSVVAHTYQAALNVLGLSGRGDTVHQAKFNMGFVLAVAAKKGHALITDFGEEDLVDEELRDFQDRVSMKLDPSIDKLFPEKWQGRVVVTDKAGAVYEESVVSVKGDPDLSLTKEELEEKMRALAAYGGLNDEVKVDYLIARAWNLEKEKSLAGFCF